MGFTFDLTASPPVLDPNSTTAMFYIIYDQFIAAANIVLLANLCRPYLEKWGGGGKFTMLISSMY